VVDEENTTIKLTATPLDDSADLSDQHYTPCNTELVHIHLDMTNAFNSLSRDAILNTLLTNPLLKLCIGHFLTYYLTESVVLLPHAPIGATGAVARVKSELVTIFVTDGLHQGAVHSPLLLCATIDKAL
jgi:hypothetical protein